MIVIFCSRDKIQRVIVGIAETWPTQMQSDRKEKTYKKWIRRLKILDESLFTCAIVSLFLFEIAPLIVTMHDAHTEPGPAPYRYPLQSYFTHWLQGYWQYAAGYFYLFASSVTTHMILYISADLLLVSLTLNLSTLLNFLQIDLEEVFGGAERNAVGADGAQQRLKDVVARHHKLLWLADELSNIFGLHVFVQVSFSSVIICCFVFLTVIADGILLNNLLAALGVTAAVWMLCWPGQLLLDTSFGISEAAYRSEWYNKDAAVRRYIVTIMSRAQKPCHLTALGFSNLTLANFFKIVSTSWSYLSVLHHMYREQEGREGVTAHARTE